MNNKDPNLNLSDDLFAGEIDPTASVTLTLVKRLARRRRWQRYGRNTGAALILLCVAGWWSLGLRVNESRHPMITASTAVEIVTTKALPNGFMVSTDLESPAIVHTANDSVAILTTAKAATAPESIDDETLLQLTPGAILVHHQSHDAELIFPWERRRPAGQ